MHTINRTATQFTTRRAELIRAMLDAEITPYMLGALDAERGEYAAMQYVNDAQAFADYVRGWNDAWLAANDPVRCAIRHRAA
jgi:hypothetical protein